MIGSWRASGLLYMLLLPPLAAVDSLRDTSFQLMMEDPFPEKHHRFYSYGDVEYESSIDGDRFTGEGHRRSGTGGFAVTDVLQGPDHRVALYLGGRLSHLESSLSFARRDPAAAARLDIPADLASISFGALGKQLLDNNDSVTWRLGLRSSSDEPFADADVTSIETELVHRHDMANGDSLFWGGYWYSLQDDPGPVIGYVWRPTPDWRITLGYPFARLHWRLRADWELDAQIAPLWWEFDTRLTWHARPWLDCGPVFYTRTEANWFSRREVRDDTFLARSWRVGAFVTFKPWITAIRLEGGYSFGRELEQREGGGLFDVGDYSDRIGLQETFYSQVEFSFAF